MYINGKKVKRLRRYKRRVSLKKHIAGYILSDWVNEYTGIDENFSQYFHRESYIHNRHLLTLCESSKLGEGLEIYAEELGFVLLDDVKEALKRCI